VMELTKESLGSRPVERMAVVHVSAPEEARQFAADLAQALPCPEIIYADLTAGLSVHTGAGMLGVAFVAGRS